MGEHGGVLPLYQRGQEKAGMAGGDFHSKSLMDKLRDSYYERDHDPEISKLADRAATTYFWFIALTQIYVCTEYVIPYHFSEYDAMGRYYVKVLCWFVLINAMANWLATRCYSSFHTRTKDRPDITKSLWDDHPGPNTTRNGFQNGAREPGAEAGQLWQWCKKCEMYRPPRCHHCIICKKCVLKRDHHCYMSGACVGFHNQRFFIVMNFYVALGSFVGLYYIWTYMCDTMFVLFESNTDYFLPVAIYKCVWAGTLAWNQLFMMFHVYTLWWTGAVALGFFSWHMVVVSLGKTTNEVRKNKTHVRCTKSVAENFRSVFGAFWGLNFLFPANIIFRQTGDGKTWEGVKGL